MRLLMRPRTLAILLTASAAAIGCITSTTTRAARVDPSARTIVKTPIKAHMRDGSVVVFASGATFNATSMTGVGQRHDATRTTATPTALVPLDSVIGIETYQREVNTGRTLAYSTAAAVGDVVVIAGLAVAMFGSCPTIYADSAGTQVLQAESFSNSIAPLLARRDVDRLVAVADANGIVRLDVRNEAMETHYIDHLELVEYRHDANELALPTTHGDVFALRGVFAPHSARDAAGRDVRAAIGAEDDLAFATDSGYLSRAIAGGATEDHIDITVPRAAVGDSVALVLRARASLLQTTVLYDYMLSRPGPAALDWLGNDLSSISTIARLADWYRGNFGMRIAVRDGDHWRQVERVNDWGPSVWSTVTVIAPALGSDSVRLRVSFLADEYRIDRIAVAAGVRPLARRAIPIARVMDAANQPRPDVASALRRADARDISTQPGDRFYAEFDVGNAAPGTRTFMLGSQGYYTEWVRPSWIRQAREQQRFDPAATSSRDVLRTWRATRDTLEQRFFVRKVPVV